MQGKESEHGGLAGPVYPDSGQRSRGRVEDSLPRATQTVSNIPFYDACDQKTALRFLPVYFESLGTPSFPRLR